MNKADAFATRMAELEELVGQCRDHPPFVGSVVRDTSNRSDRDWPWWSVEVERTEEDGAEKRRVSATVRLNPTESGEPGSFEGEWLARVWQGVSVDTFRSKGGWRLPWQQPTGADLQAAITALLDAAEASIAQERRRQRP